MKLERIITSDGIKTSDGNDRLMGTFELAIATTRGEPERGALVADVRTDMLDRLCDQLFLAGVPS